MKVLVVGSRAKEQTSLGAGSQADPFQAVCLDLGAALANARHELVLGSEAEHTADAHVARGASAEALKANRRVRCWYLPRTAPSHPPFADLSGLEVIVKNPTRPDWESVSAQQVELADAVLTVGGSRRTRTAAYLAMAQRKPLVAIASQGGASKDISEDVKSLLGGDPDVRRRFDELAGKFGAEEAEAAVRLLVELSHRPARRRPLLPAKWFLLALALVLLAAWVRTFAAPWPDGVAAFFLLSGLAALLGTVLRNVLRVVFDPTAEVTWTRLQHDAAAGVLLGFLLLLVYLAGAALVAGEGQTALPPGGDGRFHEVAVLVSLLGTTGGLLIEEVAERLRKLLIDRLKTPP